MKTSDCIVVGGGVIGLSIARRLSADGLKILLLERGVCGAESSWAGAGVLSPCNPHRRDELASLRARSLEMYPGFCAQLHDETGIDPEYEACGELELALDEASAESLRSDVEAGRDLACGDGKAAFAWLAPHEAIALEPNISPEIVGAMESRLTAQVRNPRLLRALRTSCEKKGVSILEQTEVKGLLKESQRVIGVVTAKESIAGGMVILAAGAWSGQIDAEVGKQVAVKPVRGQMILMKFERRPFQRVIARGKTYLVPRRDGHVLLGATEEPDAGFSKRTTAAGISGLLDRGMRLAPAIRDAAVVATWAGLRPLGSTDQPQIGPVEGWSGVIAATGHFRAGLILAPITAELVRRHLR